MSSSATEKHLKTQLDELQRQYDNLTSRIAALDTDLGRELDSERKLVLEERRADLAAKRDTISSRQAEIESQEDSPKKVRVQDMRSDNVLLAVAQESPSTVRVSLRMPDEQETSGLVLFQDEVEGEGLNRQLQEFPMLAVRYSTAAATDFGAKIGRNLYACTIPEPVGQALKILPPSTIDLVIDDSLQRLPWETLYDEQGFLCFRHKFGRRIRLSPPGAVNTRLLPPSYPAHKKAAGLRVLIVVLPSDLGAASEEAQFIYGVCSTTNPSIDVNLLISPSRQEVVNALYRKPDIVHWIGHSSDDGLHLGDATMQVDTLASVASELGQHCFYFFNVCATGRIGMQQPISYYLAKQGVSSVCPLTWVGESAKGGLVPEFYTSLLNGTSVGEALQSAKMKAQHREQSWWVYALYGDASWRLVEPKVK
jgi:CHAT domain-containing protein